MTISPTLRPTARSVVFSRYDGDAIELWRLDLETRPRAGR